MKGYYYEISNQKEDQRLWMSVVEGNINALGLIFDRYVQELHSYGYRLSNNSALTQDAIQDVFIQIWHYHENLAKDVQVKFYLYKCLRRTLLNTLTKENIYTGIFDEEMLEDNDDSFEDLWIQTEEQHKQDKQLADSLDMLSLREKEIISLKYFSGMKIKDIALLLNLKEQTIANTLQNALTKLRSKLVYCITLFFLFFN
ncbi:MULTISPECIES: RNA polymerase sigma factor [Arcicella]|uniref:Sigma-70 family RNA polymerase sigma factor n=1 Tax=Arcicella lustrica TaxID=2984196 RepID=A0ABU5SKV7_9BACT|nr:sigma-70 family RNA polymerase sigma factor [Arcicella sp. DC25W]MEA5427890.1 sigma-70 family RNA polymerase sigma factor [Arcicella sp. DC25W]